jgi:hypothetical protein
MVKAGSHITIVPLIYFKTMNTNTLRLIALGMSCLMTIATSHAQDKKQDPKAMMDAMAAAGALNENHKLLESMVGNWDYRVKMWMDPSTPPQESAGSTSNTSIMGGRFIQANHSGKMTMTGPDGKTMAHDFQGIGMTGYDNMKKKFVTTWLDNMSTSITMLEGTHDPAAKTITFQGTMQCPLTPGTPLQIRQVVRIIDANNHVMEWYDSRSGKETKSMEITYTRKK